MGVASRARSAGRAIPAICAARAAHARAGPPHVWQRLAELFAGGHLERGAGRVHASHRGAADRSTRAIAGRHGGSLLRALTLATLRQVWPKRSDSMTMN